MNAKKFLPFRLVDDQSDNPVLVLRHLLERQRYPRFVPYMSSFPYIQVIEKLKIQPEQEGSVAELQLLDEHFANPYEEYIRGLDFAEAFQALEAPAPQLERL